MDKSMHPRPRQSKLIAKKHRILNLIFREKHCSRFYLARRLNINASMVGNYVEELLKKGLLLEDYAGPTRRGRSPVPVRLNPNYGCFLGLDFESRHQDRWIAVRDWYCAMSFSPTFWKFRCAIRSRLTSTARCSWRTTFGR